MCAPTRVTSVVIGTQTKSWSSATQTKVWLPATSPSQCFAYELKVPQSALSALSTEQCAPCTLSTYPALIPPAPTTTTSCSYHHHPLHSSLLTILHLGLSLWGWLLFPVICKVPHCKFAPCVIDNLVPLLLMNCTEVFLTFNCIDFCLALTLNY